MRLSIGACLGLMLMLFAAPSHAQCCFYQQTAQGQANVFLNGEINRITTKTASPSRSGTHARTPAPATPRQMPIADRVQVAGMEALRPGLQRRWTALGADRAQAWYVQTATTLGSRMGRLVPEYNQRLARDGAQRADQWYIDEARRTGQELGR